MTTIASKGTTVATPPRELYIETTNRCNLACTTCPQHWGMPEAPADLNVQTVERLLDQVPGVQRVILHGIGEPLLNKELPGIVRTVKARGAYALFNSNGLLLRGRVVEPLIESGLDELRVSVDSATPEVYRQIRGIDGLERIFANVQAFGAAKQRLGSVTPKVSLWITGMKTNVGDLPALIARAADIGIGEVYLQRLVHSERGNARADQALFGQADQQDLEAIHQAEGLARDLGVTLRGSGEATSFESLEANDADLPYQACRRPWSLMYVTSNGNVLPCCIAPFTPAPYDDIKLGNVFIETIEEVWNGPRYRQWRSRMLSEQPPQACEGCGSSWSL